jgi:uncharacterized membrane protein YfhO
LLEGSPAFPIEGQRAAGLTAVRTGTLDGGDQPRRSHEENSASIREYTPNRVAVAAHAESPGYLVLTDVWFPGWECTVDGQPARIYRANFLFRAVAIPAGEHDIEFIFSPSSYRWGQRISVAALIAVLGLSFLFRYRKKKSH